MGCMKISSVYQAMRIVEALIQSGYTVTVKPVYKNEIGFGGPSIDHFEITRSGKDDKDE